MTVKLSGCRNKVIDNGKGNTMDLNEFLELKDCSLSIDWSCIENDIGFQLHDDLKKLYSRTYSKYVRGVIKFNDTDFLVSTGNKTFDEWFSKNNCNGEVEISLNLIKDRESVDSTVRKAWKDWMGPFDFGKRILIGNFDMDIGSILILFNNDTGCIEWLDSEYGGFGDLEKDPNGIIAYNIDEFLNKLSVNIS